MSNSSKIKKGQGKLSPKWFGPFRVLSQLSPSGFKVRHILSGKIKTVHPENMKIVAEESAPLDMVPQARIPLHPLEDAESDYEQAAQPEETESFLPQGEGSQYPTNSNKSKNLQKKKRKENQLAAFPQPQDGDHWPPTGNEPEQNTRRNPTRNARSNISYADWDESSQSEHYSGQNQVHQVKAVGWAANPALLNRRWGLAVHP